jgi:hypothetical protein
MKKSMAGACAVAFVAALGGGGTASSQETGIAEIHSWVKVGRKTCMLDHFHDGSGNGPTRTQAERAAIRAWVEFTAWEYGPPWGNYAIAASRSMNCTRGAGGWSCAVEARPCRPY